MNQKVFSNQSLGRKNWRAITVDYAELSKYSDESNLYCLTDFQVAWLMSMTAYYNWATRWVNNNATQEELDEQQAELEYSLMSCVQLNPAQIEYIYNITLDEQLIVFGDDWDGSLPSSINSNAPDDFFEGDGSSARNEALCSALKIYVYTYADAWVNKATAILGVGAVIALGGLILGVGGIIAITVLASVAFVTQVAMDAMQDTDALDDVVCCMNDQLDGLAITQANWETALDNCGFAVGSNQQIIADFIGSDIEEDDNWFTFINTLGDSYVRAQAGVIDCPCNLPVTLTVTFDALGWTDYTITTGAIDGTFGDPSPSNKGVDVGGNLMVSRVRVILPNDDNTISSVTISGKLDAGSNWVETIHLKDEDAVTIQTKTFPNLGSVGWKTNTWVVAQAGIKFVDFVGSRTAVALDPIWLDNLVVTFTKT